MWAGPAGPTLRTLSEIGKFGRGPGALVCEQMPRHFGPGTRRRTIVAVLQRRNLPDGKKVRGGSENPSRRVQALEQRLWLCVGSTIPDGRFMPRITPRG